MAKKVIQAQMQQRRDTAANWAASNPVLLDGEMGIVTDDPNLYKVGDGVTAWNDLKLRGFDGTLVQTTGDSENAVMSQKAVTAKLTELESKVQEDIANIKPIVINGDVVNAADEEDITSEDNLLKLKDRDDALGMGYVILRKNKTFAEQVTKANTIYEIRYDFELSGDVNIPDNSILMFEGGSLNKGNIIFNNTKIGGNPKIYCDTISGNIQGNTINVTWFQKNTESDWSDTFSKVIHAFPDIHIPEGEYICNSEIFIPDNRTIYGDGYNRTIIVKESNTPLFYGVNTEYCVLKNFKIIAENNIDSSILDFDGIRNSDFRIEIHSKERYNIAKFTGIMLRGSTAEHYIAYNTFSHIRCRGCGYGIRIAPTNSAWVTTNIFRHIFITAFSQKGVCIEKDTVSPVFANEFHVIVQDGIIAENSTIGVELAGYENTLYITSWADSAGTNFPYYALKLNLPSNQKPRNKIYGYIEGLIDGYASLYDIDATIVTLDRSNPDNITEVLKVDGKIDTPNLFNQKYLSLINYAYDWVGRPSLLKTNPLSEYGIRITPNTTEQGSITYRFSTLGQRNIRASVILKVPEEVESSSAIPFVILIQNKDKEYATHGSIYKGTYTAFTSVYEPGVFADSAVNIVIKCGIVDIPFEIVYIGLYEVQSDIKEKFKSYSLNEILCSPSCPVSTNVKENSNTLGLTPPSNPYHGNMFFSATLQKPIWFDAIGWIDASGYRCIGEPISRPTNPYVGFKYYNTLTSAIEIWNGESWEEA